jgi:hypothetical protein
MKIPEKKRPGQPIKAEDWNLLIEALQARTISSGVGYDVMQTTRGFSLRIAARNTSPGTQETMPCPFGNVVWLGSGESAYAAIRGGSVSAGPENWLVADTATPTTPGSYVVYLSAVVVANMDDDGAILLPGIAEGISISTMQFGNTLPSSVNPTAEQAQGTAVIYLGDLTISEEGGITYWRNGCGSILLDQCNGSWRQSRF